MWSAREASAASYALSKTRSVVEKIELNVLIIKEKTLSLFHTLPASAARLASCCCAIVVVPCRPAPWRYASPGPDENSDIGTTTDGRDSAP